MTLRIENGEVRYAGVVALSDVSLAFERSSISSVVGPNGAGKSTLLGALSGHRALNDGQVLLDDKPVGRRRAALTFARAGIRRTFQTSRLVPGLSVLENVRLGAAAASAPRLVADLLDTPGRRATERASTERAIAALRTVGLEHIAATKAGRISYGQVRLVEVARALVGEPSYLLLDEPAAGLNSAESEDLGDLLVKLADDGVGVVLVEHNIGLVMSISQHVHVLNFGRLIASGAPADVSADPAVIEAYTGVRT